MKDSKNLVIGMLCAVVCVMAVAYAAFSTTLTINGTATVASNWKVGFTSVECEVEKAAGGVESIGSGDTLVELDAAGSIEGTAGSSTIAHFTMTFLQPGDSATCTVTVTNGGSLPAKIAAPVDGAYWTESNPTSVITFGVSGVTEGKALAAGASDNTIVITASYDETTTQPAAEKLTNELTLTIPYVQG